MKLGNSCRTLHSIAITIPDRPRLLPPNPVARHPSARHPSHPCYVQISPRQLFQPLEWQNENNVSSKFLSLVCFLKYQQRGFISVDTILFHTVQHIRCMVLLTRSSFCFGYLAELLVSKHVSQMNLNLCGCTTNSSGSRVSLEESRQCLLLSIAFCARLKTEFPTHLYLEICFVCSD